MSTLPPVDPVSFTRLRQDNSCQLSVGDRVLTVKHHPTHLWMGHLASAQMHRIFPTMLRRTDYAWLYSQLTSPHMALDMPDLRLMMRAVIAEVTGVPWYVGARLAGMAERSWIVTDSICLLRGIDLMKTPIRRSLSVLYTLQREACKDENETAVMDRELWALPDGETPKWTVEQQVSSFAAFRAMRSSHTAAPPMAATLEAVAPTLAPTD